jgi:ABC-type multidrug transport system fused ATPase/permease subunit
LFSGTVFENVAYGLFGTEKADLPLEEQRALIEKACKDAYADEFIERLPKVRSSPHASSLPAHAVTAIRLVTNVCRAMRLS